MNLKFQAQNLKHLFGLNKYFYKYRYRFLLGIVFVVLSNVFRVLQPQVIRKALDQILGYIQTPVELRQPEVLSQSLTKFGLSIFIFAVLMGLFMFMMRQTIIVVSRLIEYDLRKVIFNHYITLDTSFYKSNKTGDLMSRIVEDVNKVRMYLGPAMLYGINLLSIVLIVIITMFQVNPMLSCYTLLPLPVLSYIIYLVSNKINKQSELIQAQLAGLTSQSQESFSGVRILKSYGIESYWSKDFNDSAGQYKSHMMNLAKIDAMFFPSMLLLIGASTLITIYVGGLNVFEGRVTTGNIAEFVIYVTMLTWPVSAIGWCASIIQQAEASQKRINAFLQTSPSIKGGTHPLKLNHTPRVEFHQVSFRYPESGIQALQNINLKIDSGQSIGIIGRTASGKSSLTELLLRMYDSTEGTITIDQRAVQTILLEDIRKLFSYVPQDSFLFSDTILENLRFGNPDLSQDEIEKYCQIAQIHEDIINFPHGYETLLGERGVNLSGGQKQRLCLARALAKKSRILLLDDCLSAVDAKTELNVLEHLKEGLEGRSLLLITQRIRQVQNMDYIYVMGEGHIIQEGTFNELLAIPGLFQTLYNIENQNKYLE